MLSKELRKNIKRIEIYTNKLVTSMFGGEYQSAFKGQGMEFAEVREYVYGDDIRSIDWNVTARTGIPHIKIFQETREQIIIFSVDVSSSLYFGSLHKLKSEVAAELTALLAFSAIRNNDKVGLLIFSDKIEKFIPPAKGTQHVLRIVREILGYKAEQNNKTDLNVVFEYLNKALKECAIIFIMSDFLDNGYEQGLKILARKNDVIAVNIYDKREKDLFGFPYLNIVDSESNKRYFINGNNKEIIEKYKEKYLLLENGKNDFFRKHGIASINIDATQSFIEPLINFLKKREKYKI